MTYERLMIESEYEVKIKEKSLEYGFKGLYKNGKVIIDRNLKVAEKTCILAEELGHHYTTIGNIIDQTKIENRKQELKARRWAVDKLIRVEQFIDAFKAGVRNRHELAEFLEVTEEFIDMAIDHFKGIYGLCHTIDNYIVYFEPLIVLEKF
ncbi:ImmA/IrrE family metallo-endopeptidase [Alkaliphilus sp. MSJ-5]|uniref:ImmA/IrrE family metallo-endopeptidase n=1 Tax=Alkaliphilus flagellatus TaxID=2841507 RepID=A0ABS6G925_9FIRM|nr:ImmA/IrrE family metallo-endopeptidase [Alkaliphilus flagellatus]MBU5677881.1 ImmA/IrrE family metallo-endopeptidase [Alkaliphilus flagellatus]